jgi:hypothetical protein
MLSTDENKITSDIVRRGLTSCLSRSQALLWGLFLLATEGRYIQSSVSTGVR